ncbi:D-glycero-beta-D-manno-heptose-1,7-bisphosphate+7-phosphatase [Methylocapsa aurea]|uniref:D-glycero-alpha-D-manno-heptose-1,7-bisphosphate 7-phosphatase n=1 Tax=Methylocapsa aurea TaxID=663610 RepID=UPI003D18BAE7
MRAVAFLDRDGVLNVDVKYLGSVDKLIWIEGASRAVTLLREAGFDICVVTNQSGVARGYYDQTAVNTLHDEMQRQLTAAGAYIDEFVFCPHHPDSDDPRYAVACDCRKPKPGMLLSLIERRRVDPAASLMIGDKASDMEAARAAGVPGYLFSGGRLDAFVEKILTERAHSGARE